MEGLEKKEESGKVKGSGRRGSRAQGSERGTKRKRANREEESERGISDDDLLQVQHLFGVD